MKSDILIPKVEDVAVAVIPEENALGETEWSVYLINMQEHSISGVLVTSRGYGKNISTQRPIKSSTLRHFLDTLAPQSYRKIEPIQEELFALNNEYWVSFYKGKLMHDKKYIFMAESVKKENFTSIPLLDKMRVMIQ